jgi:hypothetical protein
VSPRPGNATAVRTEFAARSTRALTDAEPFNALFITAVTPFLIMRDRFTGLQHERSMEGLRDRLELKSTFALRWNKARR